MPGGRGVLKQPIAIGIQPSMIAISVHSPLFFGIISASPSLKQPAGASEGQSGHERVRVGRPDVVGAQSFARVAGGRT